MIYLYRCLGCLEVFSSRESAERHDKKCRLVGYLTMTLDEFLKGRSPQLDYYHKICAENDGS
jgi:hypothetical protein